MERKSTAIVIGILWSKISMKNYKDYRLGNSIAFPIRSLDLFARLISTQPTKTKMLHPYRNSLWMIPFATAMFSTNFWYSSRAG